MPGTWTCDGCQRVWAWETRLDEPCLLCGCEGGVTVDFAVEEQRRRLAAAVASARFLTADDTWEIVGIRAVHLRTLVAAVPPEAYRRLEAAA